MRIYRYWLEKRGEVLLPDGSSQPSRVFGYSNTSPAEAGEVAERNFAALQTRLNGENGPWSYDARPIREEIVREFSPENIVTRNRYGAEVLNSETLVFVDIDGFRPPAPSFLDTLRSLFSGTMHGAELVKRNARLGDRFEYRDDRHHAHRRAEPQCFAIDKGTGRNFTDAAADLTFEIIFDKGSLTDDSAPAGPEPGFVFRHGSADGGNQPPPRNHCSFHAPSFRWSIQRSNPYPSNVI